MEFSDEQQEHINSLISGAKNKAKESAEAGFNERFSAKDEELKIASAKIEAMEVEKKKVSDLNATDDEYRAAQNKRFETLEADNKALRQENEEKERLSKLVKFDSSDKEALLAAGFAAAYVNDFLLPKLSAVRGVADDKAFYKDSSGAITERATLISSLIKAHPELIKVDRAKGNNVATGKGGESATEFETLLKKSKEGKINAQEQVKLSALANEMRNKTGE